MTFPNPYKERKAFEAYVAAQPPAQMSDDELSAEIIAWAKLTGAPMPAGKLEAAENWIGWILIGAAFPLAFAIPPLSLGAACGGAFLKVREWKKERDRKSAEKFAGKRLEALAAENDKRHKDKNQQLAAMEKPKQANGELIRPEPPPPPHDAPAPPDTAAPKTSLPETKPPPTAGEDPGPPRP